MAYHRILTIQDISCLGQCSMTVALPILSACGVETCILPSAVLSTHTGGFGKPYIRDLTTDISQIAAHWCSQGIQFDVIYTGYLGNVRQIDMVLEIMSTTLAPGGKIVVDPAMADHGKLYAGFDERYAQAIQKLCAAADVILPNVTEACLLTGRPYVQEPDRATVDCLLHALHGLGAKTVVLTGVGDGVGRTGAAVLENEKIYWHHQKKIPRSYHGTGDIFASVLVGAWVRGKTLPEAAALAADFTGQCIQHTYEDPAHWYGTKFETVLPMLIRSLEEL